MSDEEYADKEDAPRYDPNILSYYSANLGAGDWSYEKFVAVAQRLHEKSTDDGRLIDWSSFRIAFIRTEDGGYWIARVGLYPPGIEGDL
jgi:hypothetical protein